METLRRTGRSRSIVSGGVKGVRETFVGDMHDGRRAYVDWNGVQTEAGTWKPSGQNYNNAQQTHPTVVQAAMDAHASMVSHVCNPERKTRVKANTRNHANRTKQNNSRPS